MNRPDILQRLGDVPAAARRAGHPGPGGRRRGGGRPPGRWKAGDRVCALLGGGGYAEYAVGRRPPRPADPGRPRASRQAAGLPETVFTVYANVFEHGGLKAGETLLLHGATSGIGVTAIQMAKAAGAKVIATGRGADKAKAALALGADVAVDATAEDFAEVAKREGGVDVVLDMVGGDYFAEEPRRAEDRRPHRLHRRPGRRRAQRADLPDHAEARGDHRLDPAPPRRRREGPPGRRGRARGLALDRRGQGQAQVDRTFPLDDAAQAHAWLKIRRPRGQARSNHLDAPPRR